MPPRCFLGCPSELAGHLHIFPNPERFPEQFQTWVRLVGGELNTPENYAFFRKKRLCHRHFTEKDHNRNNRLNAVAVPSLFLSAELANHNNTLCIGVSKPLREIDMNVPLLQTTSLIGTPRAEPADNPITSVAVSDILTEIDMNIPLLQTTSFILSKANSTANESAVNPECYLARTALDDPSPQATEDPRPSTSFIVDNPSSSDAHRACTGSGVSTFLEHNYCRRPETYNVAPLDFFNKKPFFKTNHRSEQRQIRNLKQQINSLRKRCTMFKNRLASASKICLDSAFQKVIRHMTSPAKLFTHMQFSQTHKKPSGRRFTLEEKILSLSLFKRSPKCYSLLAHCFTLPSKKTLKGILAQVKLGPGINEKIFEKLKKTVSEMSLEDRLCTIIFDEMSITPQINYDPANDKLKGFVSAGANANQIADHVLVFMIKGIKANFKQPVAYYFTNNLNKFQLKEIIVQVVEKIQATGLIILSSICDQGSVNVGAISELVKECKMKYMRQGKEWRHNFYEVKKHKIIPLYDVPHLLKGLRNNLITKDLIYTDVDDKNKEKIVKWKHFQDIYEADKTFGELRLLNKITEEHIDPLKIKKMRVKTAAQIFSHSVAVVAEHLTARGILSEDCRNLIPFVSLIDQLFDSMNSCTFHIPNGKIYKGCVRKSSPHHRLWTKAKIILKSIKFIARKKAGDKIRLVTGTIPSTNNFAMTIEGFEALWNILSKKYSFDCMMTRHFNQDPVENFFGNIRSYGARNNSPNVVAFEGAFKALLLNNFNSPHSINSNCEKDENTCLQTLDFFITDQREKNIIEEDIPEEIIEINEELLIDREIERDMGQRNYVCGWVLKKCLKNIVKGCVTCKSKLICKKDSKDNDYIKSKEYSKKKKWLIYPSDEIVNYFYEVQSNTISFLKSNVPKACLRSKIKWITNTLSIFPCNCDIHKDELKEYFMKTTINVLINSWCREINRILSGRVSYEGDDEIKNAAQLYYNKRQKTNK